MSTIGERDRVKEAAQVMLAALTATMPPEKFTSGVMLGASLACAAIYAKTAGLSADVLLGEAHLQFATYFNSAPIEAMTSLKSRVDTTEVEINNCVNMIEIARDVYAGTPRAAGPDKVFTHIWSKNIQ
jgi:hypothetical protein